MEYRLYIFLLLELMSTNQATIVLEGHQIDFSIPRGHKNRWLLSVKIGSNESDMTKDLFQTQKRLYFHSNGSSINQKENGIYLEKEVPALNRYVSFKIFLREFLEEVSEWKELFQSKSPQTLAAYSS